MCLTIGCGRLRDLALCCHLLLLLLYTPLLVTHCRKRCLVMICLHLHALDLGSVFLGLASFLGIVLLSSNTRLIFLLRPRFCLGNSSITLLILFMFPLSLSLLLRFDLFNQLE